MSADFYDKDFRTFRAVFNAERVAGTASQLSRKFAGGEGGNGAKQLAQRVWRLREPFCDVGDGGALQHRRGNKAQI